MINLFLRSVLVLALLFGLLFGIGVGAMTYLDAPLWLAVVFALVIISLQYLLGPWILQYIFKIEWCDPQTVDAELAAFIYHVCDEHDIPRPRFGIIRDGNPNAFTFGHYPGNARLVVTTGLLDLLDRDERQAVVAHELGHITHWDFVVMTIASAVPLILYLVYSWGRGRGRKGKSSYAIAIAVISYAAYIVSQYIVLLLSRVREYYADQFAGQVTGDPNALSTALVKVAYGLAAAPKDEKKDQTRTAVGRAFGIFDPQVAQSLALASAGSGTASVETMKEAMKWDLWNPWAFFFELASSHPLPAKRIRALERQSEAQGQPAHFAFRAQKPEGYWDEFLVDVLINFLPVLAMLAGAGLAALFFSTLDYTGAMGLVMLLGSAAWLLKRRFSYRHEFGEGRKVKSLVGEVKVSAVRAIPCTIEGQIIGRGIPGLFYGEDLVLQDDSGFIVVDYRQPLRILDFFFGLFKAEELIGQRGKVVGWYRRSPRPYFEMRKMALESGQTVTSYLYPVTQFILYAGVALGTILLIV
jgi:heat shock protein HtpX